MPLTGPGEILAAAHAGWTAVGAFNVIQIEHAEAIVAGAEQVGLPVILQLSENTAKFHRGLTGLGSAALAIARQATVPVVVHLDHAESEELIDEAVELGFPSVMFDAAVLPYDENVARTAAVVARCRERGVAVEAELGEVGGKDGAHAPGVRTDPTEAAAFVAATGVDSLAVAVGTSHAMSDRSAVVDLDLIRSLTATVPVPLVLHGSSGVDDPHLAEAVAAGITKVNIATRLNQVMTAKVREVLDASATVTDPRKYLGPARDAVAAEVALLLRLLHRSY
ncbi:ketose-bisphosphate aldolase [Nakamurella sp. YIM 132087]|uniref:Ketose-bisphosphate aldolase n=1 Tax=Nakamurella alba TaxID=2665158 RepID=A0A7K1FPZ8_9ACTN|nr:class II fructose-bisphosphate aldolase [Nakamurella alba]MTD16217.1 ketose-bisphosphate aldolase [Nakamurella alba]